MSQKIYFILFNLFFFFTLFKESEVIENLVLFSFFIKFNPIKPVPPTTNIFFLNIFFQFLKIFFL